MGGRRKLRKVLRHGPRGLPPGGRSLLDHELHSRRAQTRVARLLRDLDRKQRCQARADAQDRFTIPPLRRVVWSQELTIPAAAGFVASEFRPMPGIGPFSDGGPNEATGIQGCYFVGIIMDPTDAPPPGLTVILEYRCKPDLYAPPTPGDTTRTAHSWAWSPPARLSWAARPRTTRGTRTA